MISFTIDTYQVMSFTGADRPVRIYLYDDLDTYRGYIEFRRSESLQPFILHPSGVINAFMQMDSLAHVIDILRNEKPVSFVLNETARWAAIRTGLEPTGEGEGP